MSVSSKTGMSVVEQWMRLMLPTRNEMQTHSEDIASLSRLLSGVSDSLREGTLTVEEADTIVRAALSAFVSNRIYNVIRLVLEPPPRGAWFVARKGS